MGNWYSIENIDEVPSPALLIYPDRVRENIRRLIEMVGDVERLRPHLKTHKMADIVRLQLEAGIRKFKCATIAEAEMAAHAGAPDVLFAFQPVGPNVARLLQLATEFPKTHFATIADDAGAIRALSQAAAARGQTLEVLLDLDCGMHRSGIAPSPAAFDLYRLIHESPELVAGGLHAYDGHNHLPDIADRTAACEACMAPVRALRRQLESAGLPAPKLVASGSPTFPIHARSADVECSPGTVLFWDGGYERKVPDLDFLSAALVLTRVVSKPGDHRLCVDLGHKAIAAENPHPRVYFLELPDATAVMHSEEHLVLESPRATEFAVGDCLYGVPHHICPTVALYSEAVVVENGKATARWPITARARRITI